VQTLASDRCANWLRRAAHAALLVIGLSFFTVPGTGVSAAVPADGAWMVDGTGAAVQIFDCSGQLCGRIVWLRMARDSIGRLARDDKNRDPAFRQRPLCLQPERRADIPRLGRTSFGRCVSRAHISGRAALW
jgi:Uncharacterized protein conserved in bacteria (DUF2147)